MALPLPSSISSLRKNNTNDGFTLLETLLYLSLFGFIVVNFATMGFMVMQHGEKSTANLIVQAEANYIRDKLRWLMENNVVTEPSPGNNAEQLILQAGNTEPHHSIIVEAFDHQLRLRHGLAEPVSLTASSSLITNLRFEQTLQGQLIINFSLNGEAYTFHQQLLPTP